MGRNQQKLQRRRSLPDFPTVRRGEADYFIHSTPVISNQDPGGCYDFLHILGRGEFAKTYLVQHRESQRFLACKRIYVNKDAKTMANAEREITIHSILCDHPNIATLEEVWEWDKSFFLIMEYCEGGELFHEISSRGAFSERDAATVLRVVLQIIQLCHSRGIIHRDIKPENFMLKAKGGRVEKSNILAIDFGCSTFLKTGHHVYDLVGSPMYVAPEVVQGKGYEFAADLWSAGVLLFSMLSGLSPFKGQSDHEICWSVMNQQIELDTDPWPFVSSDAKDLVSRLLERDSALRVSVQEALTHPWLHEWTAPSCQPLSLLIIDRLQHFARLTSLQQILLNIFTFHRSRTASCVDYLTQLFSELDINGDGTLDFKELCTGLIDMGMDANLPKFEEIFKALDISNNGKISIVNFFAGAWDRIACRSSISEFSESIIFKSSCIDGFVSRSEMQKILHACNIQISSEILGRILTPKLLDLRNLQEALQQATSVNYAENCPIPLNGQDSSMLSQHSNCQEDISEDRTQGKDSEDYAVSELSEIFKNVKTNSNSMRGTSDESSQSFSLIGREDEGLGGRRLEGPIPNLEGSSPLGSSPGFESSWEKMMSVRGSSPATVGFNYSDSDSGPSNNWKASSIQGTSPGKDSHISSQDGFCSGGVTYWSRFTTQDDRMWDFPEEDEDLEDSDALFGPALAAREKQNVNLDYEVENF